MIILVGGEKGGTGKTKFTTNIAVTLAKRGHDVLIIDTDRQGSASSWCAVRAANAHKPSIDCVQLFGDEISDQINRLAKRYDHTIIDAGGRDSGELRESMATADVMVIPIQPSQFDIWTSDMLDKLVRRAKRLNIGLKACVMLNRATTNRFIKEADETQLLLSDLEHIMAPDIQVHERIAYRKAAKNGLGVDELYVLIKDNLEPVDPKAINEMALLTNFILERATND